MQPSKRQAIEDIVDQMEAEPTPVNIEHDPTVPPVGRTVGKSKIHFAAIFTLTCLLFAAVGCGGSDNFRVGLEAPLSGEQSVLGKGMLKGAELAASQLNADGGILGRQVEVVPIDDAANPAKGVRAAKAAIDEGLDGIIGPYNSSVGIETLPLYIKAGLVPIRLTSSPSTSGLGFTLQPMVYQIVVAASKALTRWFGAKSVAIVYDSTQDYTVSISSLLSASLRYAGVEVTAYKSVRPGRKSYADVVEKLAAAKPDVIYAVVYFPEGGLIAKEMHQSKVQAQCIADYGSYDSGFVETAGVAAARACPVVGVPAPQDFPGADARVSAFEAEFGQEPGTWSPYTYDSLNFLADGVTEADGTDPDKLNKVLGGVKGWKGWTGSVTVEPSNGDREPATVVIAETDRNGELHVDEDWAKAVGAPF
jgi:branched-chain amino acid transport system substrate-binding protein